VTQRAVEFFFDVGSPTAYLAWTQLPGITSACNAELIFRPMLLGGVFKATGNASPVTVPAKGRWMHQDIARWARRYNVPYQHNPHFPINTLTMMRVAAGLNMQGGANLATYLQAVMPAMWADAKNMADPAVLGSVLARAGLDPVALVDLSQQAEVKAQLVATTEDAVGRGVFGAPSMFVGDTLFFGQDRLEFVREALLV
jgi:2-hydroxychromene-2-carboxylate isomerase